MKNEKFLSLFLIIVFFFFSSMSTSAQTNNYVLPYPSVMPGGFMYKVGLVKEFIQKYWSFGNFSQFHYNLHYADKYLVEAKTLFEYKQYLLGINALKRSDRYFIAAYKSLKKAEEEGKNISLKKEKIEAASRKHVETLELLTKEMPVEFIWAEEKKTPVTLLPHRELKESIDARNTR